MQTVTSGAVAEKFNGFIKYFDRDYGDVTIGSANYTLLGQNVSDKTIIGTKITKWSVNTGGFNVIVYGASNDCYLIGYAGVQVTQLIVRFFYIDD